VEDEQPSVRNYWCRRRGDGPQWRTSSDGDQPFLTSLHMDEQPLTVGDRCRKRPPGTELTTPNNPSSLRVERDEGATVSKIQLVRSSDD
jgi:hypothetical protein